MAKYLCPEALDNGPAYIQANCNQMAAVKAYAIGDTYATVMAPGNVIASSPMVPGDFSFSDGAGSSRVLNNATKSVAASKSDDPTHIVFVNTTASKVLRVTQETSAVVTTSGQSAVLPNCPLTKTQPA